MQNLDTTAILLSCVTYTSYTANVVDCNTCFRIWINVTVLYLYTYSGILVVI
jgi:hypothetical protein